MVVYEQKSIVYGSNCLHNEFGNKEVKLS